MGHKPEEFVDFVKRLSRKLGAVNLIYSAEDIEQEGWVNIIKNWHKKNGRTGKSMNEMTFTEIKKNITTIMKCRTIDIKRAAIRRPDCHWSYKSNVIDTKHITDDRNSMETFFTSKFDWPDESLLQKEMENNILSWAENESIVTYTLLKALLSPEPEILLAWEEAISKNTRHKPARLLCEILKIDTKEYPKVVNKLKEYLASSDDYSLIFKKEN